MRKSPLPLRRAGIRLSFCNSVLQRIDSSPVVELNRAAAVAMWDGPEAGLEIIDRILSRGELGNDQFAHTARSELLQRAGKGQSLGPRFSSHWSLPDKNRRSGFWQHVSRILDQ